MLYLPALKHRPNGSHILKWSPFSSSACLKNKKKKNKKKKLKISNCEKEMPRNVRVDAAFKGTFKDKSGINHH